MLETSKEFESSLPLSNLNNNSLINMTFDTNVVGNHVFRII